MSGDIHRVYAARLASVHRPARDNFLQGPERAGSMRMDFSMWIIVGESRVMVVDTGFSAEAGRRRGRTLERRPAEVVESLGISPADVTDVILTHLHYDHAGNTGDFPQARIWVQRAEMQYVSGPSMRHATLSHFFESDDVSEMIGHLFAGNLHEVDGDVELTEGVHLFRVGGHTPGLQIVRVRTSRGDVILASDALHYYENLELRNPFPGIVDVAEMMDGYEKLLQLAPGNDHIIAGHDPLVVERYAGAEPGLPDGVVALHAAPTHRDDTSGSQLE